MALKDRIEHDTIVRNLLDRYKKALDQVADTNIFAELRKKGINPSLAEFYIGRIVMWMITEKELKPGAPHELQVYRLLNRYFPHGL